MPILFVVFLKFINFILTGLLGDLHYLVIFCLLSFYSFVAGHLWYFMLISFNNSSVSYQIVTGTKLCAYRKRFSHSQKESVQYYHCQNHQGTAHTVLLCLMQSYFGYWAVFICICRFAFSYYMCMFSAVCAVSPFQNYIVSCVKFVCSNVA